MATDSTATPRSPLVALVLAWAQGLYFFIFGIWPLISIDTFQAVTGKKTDHLVTGREADHWLVNTVGLLLTIVGLVLMVAAWRQRISAEIVLLAIGSAIALAAIDLIYVLRKTIAPIYLVDFVIELIFVVGWALYACHIVIGRRNKLDNVR